MKKNVHIFRYGTNAEQKFILNSSKTFDLLAINGNMMAHAPKAISSFIVKLLLKEPAVGFFVDPITHSFQHDLSKIKSYSSKNDKYEIKSSIMKLVDAYGEPVKSRIKNDQSVMPEDFNNNDVLDKFCKSVVEFQLSSVRTNIKLSELDDFLAFENENYSNESQFYPRCIIPPYFYINNNDWIDVNIRAILSVKSQYPQYEVFAQIVIPQNILDDHDKQSELINKLVDCHVSGIMLWVDQFSEHEQSFEQLSKFVDLLMSLRKLNVPIYNLYGSFFSIMLTSSSIPNGALLTGVGHGLEYGESRAVVPVGGGIPNNKFYYYRFHNRLDYKTMSDILFNLGLTRIPNAEAVSYYHKNICNCKVCKQIISDGIDDFQKFESTLFYEMELKGTKQRRNYADKSTKTFCVMHYQANKAQEFSDVNKNPAYFKNIINELEDTIKDQAVLPSYLDANMAHLIVWKKIIENIMVTN